MEAEAARLPSVGAATISDDPAAIGQEMRRTLGLVDGWANLLPTWTAAVSELRGIVEALGVMAVIDGVVGNDTRRRLDVNEFRGFALSDPHAPLIFVNGAIRSPPRYSPSRMNWHTYGWVPKEKVCPGSRECDRAAMM